ncbi:MAG: dockerin type I repeat-containing protein [Ruminococcus sp.]|uniref:dockerin type I repeat-containing protein n=1 Tax=Ruminococcus sp. TaxID=41978 RepID=UPI0025CDEB68|nr:dockerin type I repeat-containing protein [Ruminococcus sp.]MCR5600744.1 dockerin type I repeat-containing protein [Ruminococcus sp.]
MSDLKLYKGINNIDDDLIEEADRKQKPIVHHCYAIAASAAAIFIAAGATGIFHTGCPDRDHSVYNNNVISDNSVTTASAIPEKSSLTSTQTTAASANKTAASEKPSVSYSKTNTILTTVASVSTEPAATTVNLDSSDPKNYDFEYEGSIIMKKYAALLSSLLILSNGTAAHAQQPTYMPKNEDIQFAERAKDFIEKYDLDLDLNCDGKFDIFDLYAFYRAETSSRPRQIVGTTVGTIPDYIMEKYNDIPKVYTVEETNDKFEYTLDTTMLTEYYLTYYNDLKLDYYEPEFYIANCPDDYQDDFPYDFIRQDDKSWSMWDFQKTMYIKQESDGSYRFYNEDDAKAALKNMDSYHTSYAMRYMKNLKVSPIHEFISKLRFSSHYTSADYPLMKEFVENGYADTDINSDGVFDFEDIIKIAIFAGIHIDCERETFIDQLFYPESNEFSSHYGSEYYPHIITEDEWNKAFTFCDTAANYFYTSSPTILTYLTQYYLTYNEVDPKYFDPMYYEERNIAHYNVYSCPQMFFGYLGDYKAFSEKYGPNATGNNERSPEEIKRFDFTKDEIDAAFPVYYKKVKTGVLPKPDINLDGKIDVADYNILYNLNYEICIPYSNDTIATMIRNHPELNFVIGISQETRDNFNTNFDFNNNGISGDSLEIDCMMMYILNELSSQYEDENIMNKAIDNFYVEHPELQFYEIFNEKLEEFHKKRNTTLTDPEATDAPANILDSVQVLKSYSSFPKVNMLKTLTGDANCDGTVDLADSIIIMQSLANPSKYGINGSNGSHITDEGCLRADIDGDGVTNMDALTIQKYLLGLCSI